MGTVAVVLAAGQGTRMKSDTPKVAHRAAGRPLINWVLDGIPEVDRTIVVVGHGAEEVTPLLPQGVEHVVQSPQRGTGHAVLVALEAADGLADDDVVIMAYGDMPLVSPKVYAELLERCTERTMALVTVDLDDPRGFGRVMRDESGRVAKIVEEADADESERSIAELNAGIYALGAGDLRSALGQLSGDNAQGELYLTDVIEILAGWGLEIVTVGAAPTELLGVNTQAHLAEVEAELRRRINRMWMEAGVRMLDPESTYIDHDVELAAGVVLYPGCYLEKGTIVGQDAVLGPDVFAVDSHIGPQARVMYSVLRGARVGEAAQVGPYASLREGAELESGSKAGTFVELKNTRVGPGAKVPHLSYMGDAVIGDGANIGAGTITCNYDGMSKHETRIGKGAFIGSDTMLVAPVVVGDDAMTGAGSVITRDVEDGALAIERSEQKNIPDFATRRGARYRSKRDKA